jgi:aspartokinase
MAQDNQRRHYAVKLGGSVLKDDNDYAFQAERIAEFMDNGNRIDRIYVIVSAAYGATNRLADMLCGSAKRRAQLDLLLQRNDYTDHEVVAAFDNADTAAFMLEGEIESAWKMDRCLRSNGLEPRVLIQGNSFPIIANGRYLNASVDYQSSQLNGAFEGIEERIVVVPGFGAENHHKEPVLLGRNSSDFVAALFGYFDPLVSEVAYIKDVPGVMQDYGTPRARAIQRISARELKSMGRMKVLDHRCLDHIPRHSGFRVQDSTTGISQGGTLIYQN